MTNYLLELHQLNITDQQGQHLISNLDLNIEAHKVNVLIGESGSGKSLTASVLVQQSPSDLNVTFNQLLYDGLPIQKIAQLLGHKIGYISQHYASSFNDHTRLKKQLLAIYHTHFVVSKAEALAKVEQALKWVHLSPQDILDKYRFMLSGGQLERVYIASVLMLEPELIIADEPVSALDIINGQRIMELIEHIAKVHNTTLLLITHNLTHVLRYADYINVIKSGSIIEKGTIKHFKNDTIHPYTKKLFEARSQLLRKDDIHA